MAVFIALKVPSMRSTWLTGVGGWDGVGGLDAWVGGREGRVKGWAFEQEIVSDS